MSNFVDSSDAGKSSQLKRTKNRKKFYKSCSKRRRNFEEFLTVGVKGILFTCGNKEEKRCVADSLSIVRDALAKDTNIEPGSSPPKRETEETVEEEIERLKEEGDPQYKENKDLYSVETGVKNCVFFVLTNADPSTVVTDILEDAAKNRGFKSRFVKRMIPVESSCRADYDVIADTVSALLGSKMESGQITGSETYAIEYKARNNHDLHRDEIIQCVGAAMESVCPMSKVLLSDPDLTILVNVLKTICCISIVKNYLRYKRFNLFELSVSTVSPL